MGKRPTSESGGATLFNSGAPPGSSYFRVDGGSESVEIEVQTGLMYRIYPRRMECVSSDTWNQVFA